MAIQLNDLLSINRGGTPTDADSGTYYVGRVSDIVALASTGGGNVSTATTGGVSTNGVTYDAGVPIITFPDGTTWVDPTVNDVLEVVELYNFSSVLTAPQPFVGGAYDTTFTRNLNTLSTQYDPAKHNAVKLRITTRQTITSPNGSGVGSGRTQISLAVAGIDTASCRSGGSLMNEGYAQDAATQEFSWIGIPANGILTLDRRGSRAALDGTAGSHNVNWAVSMLALGWRQEYA